MVGHEGQRGSAGEGDGRRKLPCKEIDHGNGEGTEDQRDNSEIPFRFGKWIELMGEDKKQRRMEIRGVLFVEFYLVFEVISRVIECMDFIHPERFLVEGIESQGKAYEEAENKDNNFFLF